MDETPDQPVTEHLEDTMDASIRRAAVIAAVATASVAGATAAQAQENVRGSISFPASPLVVCDGGVEIGMPLDVDFTFHWTYEGEALVQERLTMRYTGRFVNLSTGETSTPVRGTSNTLVDLVDGTLTSSGSPRTMTMPGVGTVLLEAGHFVIDQQTGEVVVERGPKLNESTVEGAQAVCAAMGLTGGVPLTPPDVHD